MDNKYEFGFRLKSIREANGITMEELADLLKKSTSTVYGYEVNQIIPPQDTLCQMAKLFNMTVDELMGFEKGTTQKDGDWYRQFALSWRKSYEEF